MITFFTAAEPNSDQGATVVLVTEDIDVMLQV
jgi:hypothetical protein